MITRRPFNLTPTRRDSPYDPTTLCFLQLAGRGAFAVDAQEAWAKKNFAFKEECLHWPLFARSYKGSLEVCRRGGRGGRYFEFKPIHGEHSTVTTEHEEIVWYNDSRGFANAMQHKEISFLVYPVS